MFLGEFSHSLDAKGRITIPARFRDELEQGVVLTPGYEQCLTIFPQAQFAALSNKISEMSYAKELTRLYQRRMFGRAFEASLDKLGRVLVPTVLREYAGIDSEAVIVGLNTHFEIWQPERWSDSVALQDQNLEAMLAEASRSGV